jgi:hypothetical protein
MAQHDYVISNASGATVRADINSALSAIQTLNSGTSEPSSTAAGMLWLDTTGGAPYALKVRDAGNNHWLTLASVTDPGSDGNIETSATIKGTIDSTASGTLGDNIIFPAGHVLQVVHTETSETNTLDSTYTNYYEVPLTLKSNSSDVIVTFTFQYNISSNVAGFGVKIYRKNSAGVTTSDTAVWTKNTGNSTGPFTIYYNGITSSYGVSSITGKDTLTGLNAGDTIYYGLFARRYQTDDNIIFPTSSTEDGFFSSLIMEVQK